MNVTNHSMFLRRQLLPLMGRGKLLGQVHQSLHQFSHPTNPHLGYIFCPRHLESFSLRWLETHLQVLQETEEALLLVVGLELLSWELYVALGSPLGVHDMARTGLHVSLALRRERPLERSCSVYLNRGHWKQILHSASQEKRNYPPFHGVCLYNRRCSNCY